MCYQTQAGETYKYTLPIQTTPSAKMQIVNALVGAAIFPDLYSRNRAAHPVP